MVAFRFSMRNLLLAILVFGLSLAVLQWNSEVVASLAFTVFLTLLAIGVVGAFCRRGAARAFWIGFAVFGWLYAEAAFSRAGGSLGLGGIASGFISRSYTTPQRSTGGPILLSDVVFDYATVNSHLRVGNKVMAQWRSGGYYEATLTQINGRQYLAQWTDGSAPSWVSRSQIEVYNVAGRQAAHCVMAIFVALVGAMLAEMFFARNPHDHQEHRTATKAPARQPDRVDGPSGV